jgi:Uncharacterized conserved protein
MEKLDLSKKYKSYYTAKPKPEIVEIEDAQYLSVTGKGDPSGADFATDIEALYSTAYNIKFAFKEQGNDFVVAKLEGLWWYDEGKYGKPSMDDAPKKIPRSEWEYRLLVRLPEYITEQDVLRSKENVILIKKLQAAHKIEYYTMPAHKAVQMMHVGPFDTEPQTLKQIAVFMDEHSMRQGGLHHEIYLSDFRKTAPGKLKTILREPIG